MSNLEEVRKFFEKDRFATENGMIIDAVGEKYAKCSMTVSQRHMNAVGNEEPGIVSLSSTITFHATAKGEKIICEAKKIKHGRTTCVYEMTVTDENDNLLATVLTTGYNTRKQ